MRVYNTRPAPVYPHRDRLLGTDWIIDMSKAIRSHTILRVWDNLFYNVGGTFWVKNVGAWIVTTNEPENVKALLSSQFEAWHIRGLRQKVMVLALGPRAIFSVNGQEWHDARAMIRPSFVRNQITDLECTERHVEAFLARIPRNGDMVDLQELFYMFGHSTNTLSNPTPEALKFTQSFDYSLLSSTSRARLGWIALIVPDKKLDKSAATCRQFIDRYVQEAIATEKEKERPYVFMNEMLASGASKEYLRDQLLAMILGGRDTSASTLSSLFWALARRPDVVKKMRAEIEEMNGQKPTWDELKELKYLNMVLKEGGADQFDSIALRLWAPVASNVRMASKDTVLPKGGGPDGQSPLFVPKGAGCRWSLYSLHRRKDIFGDDAEEFRPERWETLRTTYGFPSSTANDADLCNSWEYLPFGGGPRICIGQQFALTQMTYLVTRLLQTFKTVEAADDKPMVQGVSSTIKLVNGCWTRFTPA
ncbi:cytochrome P450 52E1 [Fusarium albosuccineum]|uniref:Cytochrome P450 52E1 n=1 Tax=Fusarium albosuccineum TaxID=1237068 RepID=A0A8H4LB00_9HYPO|nr:cytochrome P450 52E1 [Fusarium albosuccineum]